MNKRRLRLIYIFFDILAAVITWVLFMYFRKTVNDANLFSGVYVFIPNYNFYTSLFLFPFCCLFIHYLSGFYQNPQKHRQLKVFFTTLVSSVIISIAIFFALLLDDIVVSYHFYYYALLVLLGILFVITLFFRTVICAIVRSRYKSGNWTVRTAIIGTGENAQKIAKELKKRLKENTLVGYIAEDKKTAQMEEPVLGTLSQVETIIQQNNIQQIIIALEHNDEKKLFSIVNSLYQYNIEISFTPGIYEILIGGVRMKELGLSPLVSITSSPMSDWETCVKRFFDITVSLVSLIVLLPLFLFFAIRIKINSPGPVFFRQERIGFMRRPFNILKFRTMYVDAEKGGTPQLSNASDKRITSVGYILRKYRLDELPQFWNILKGEMSIVGPRPERAYYIRKISEVAPYYCLVYKIRPGLTSWGPIRVGYTDTVEKMVERLNYDIIYMDNMSLSTDIKILLYTIEVIFKGKGV